MSWSAADIPDQRGTRVIVTGANSGIGLEASRELARKGASVVLACRNRERAQAAAGAIHADVGHADLRIERLDLASLESIHEFAETVTGEDEADIDILVNNAGVMALPRQETEDGFEMQFGVNHLGHFALTGLVLESLANDARVVTVSSAMHERGEIDFGDLHGERSYNRWEAYAQSKLANVLFAYELDRRFREAETDRSSAAVHPGYADTQLQSKGPKAEGSAIKLAMMNAANAVFGQPPAGGALPTLYAATMPGVNGEEYYGPGGFLQMRGPPKRQRSSDRSYNRSVARRLWEVSEEATGVEYELPVPA